MSTEEKKGVTVAKECILKVGGNSYPLKRPTMGQILEVQTLKAKLTRGSYGQIVRNMDELGLMSLDIVDMIAVLSILCPEMLDDLKVKSWDDLDAFDVLDIYKGYHESVLPWYQSFTKELTAVWKKVTDSLSVKDEENDSTKS